MAGGDYTQGSGFRICGSVVRKFIPQSHKIAFLTLDVARPRSNVKVDGKNRWVPALTVKVLRTAGVIVAPREPASPPDAALDDQEVPF